MKTYFLIVLSIFLTSCYHDQTYRNRNADKNDAEKVTEKFYSSIDSNKKQETLDLFSSLFFKKTNPKDLNAILDWAVKEAKTGSSHKLTNWHTLVIEGTDPKSEYTLTYNATRGSVNTEETFNMEKEKDQIKIVGFKIDVIIARK